MHEWNRQWSQTQGLVVCQWFFLVDLLVVSLACSGLITFAHWAQSVIISTVFTFHCSLGCTLGRPIPYIISWDHPAVKTAATYLAGHEPHHTFLLFLYQKTSTIVKDGYVMGSILRRCKIIKILFPSKKKISAAFSLDKIRIMVNTPSMLQNWCMAPAARFLVLCYRKSNI
jgi:hypothetical protein